MTGDGWIPDLGDDAPTTLPTALTWIKGGKAFDPALLKFAARFAVASEAFQAMLQACRGAKVNTNHWQSGVKPHRKLRVVADDERGPAVRRFARGDHLELAEALLQEVEPTPEHRANDEGAIHRYDPTTGLWNELDRSTLALAVHTFAGAVVPSAQGERALLINSPTVDGAIEQAGHITRRPRFFASAPIGLVFKDGFAHATPNGLEWLKHSPDHRARVGYDFPCPPKERTCPKWIEFLRSIWPVRIENPDGTPREIQEIEADGADQEAKIRLCQQWFGASLVGVATRFQLALILFGTGSNGKSTLLKTLERLFPKGSLCHVAPQHLNDEYRLALLAGKRLNTVGELPAAAILDSATLKSVIDGTEVTGRQIRQEPITFTPRAGMVYSANLWPPVSDMSHGFWSRFVVLTFKEKFPRGTSGEDRDVVMAREEGPEIIAWMLDGAQELLVNRGFVVPPSSHAAIDDWRNQACTVAVFVREMCEVPPKGATKAKRDTYSESAAKLFEVYVRYTREGQRPVVSRQTFSNRMAGLGYPVDKKEDANYYPVRLKLDGKSSGV